MLKNYLLLLALYTLPLFSNAQKDSSLQNLENLPAKYFTQLDSKIDKYSSRVTKKTTKTLEKLARWETKIKSLLDKTSPETSAQLFGEGKMTFNKLLQQMQSGEQMMLQYKAGYNKYRDDLTVGIKYLQEKKDLLNTKVIDKVKAADKKIKELNDQEDQNEAMQDFIRQRKKELLQQSFQYLGKNKYLSKINKEAWYYAEAVKNYKDIFTDEKKAEQLAKSILHQIPAFQKFARQNSILASIFAQPGDMASLSANTAGLQTRQSLQSLIQERIGTTGPNAQQLVGQQVQAAQGQLNQMKEKLLNALPGGGGDVPELDFTPNMQKTKTFLQRIEYGTNIQFARNNTLMPTTMDMALTVGYKLNDKSVAGVGASYKMGLGSIERIRFTNQGLNLRSFLDWKLKKQLYVTGGYEMNYLADMPQVSQPLTGKELEAWQSSALAGITKKIKIKTKWFKETKLQLLYDFLAKEHLPLSQPLLFRVGYSF